MGAGHKNCHHFGYLVFMSFHTQRHTYKKKYISPVDKFSKMSSKQVHSYEFDALMLCKHLTD